MVHCASNDTIKEAWRFKWPKMSQNVKASKIARSVLVLPVLYDSLQNLLPEDCSGCKGKGHIEGATPWSKHGQMCAREAF